MTKKDYELIASAIKANYDMAINSHDLKPTPDYVIKLVAETIAGVLAQQNDKFDRNRFLQACGVTK